MSEHMHCKGVNCRFTLVGEGSVVLSSPYNMGCQRIDKGTVESSVETSNGNGTALLVAVLL